MNTNTNHLNEDEARYFKNIDNPLVNVEWIAGIKKYSQKSYDTAWDTYLRYKEYDDEYEKEMKDLFCENSYVARQMLRCVLPFEDCNKDLAMSLYLSYKTQTEEIEKFITNEEKQGHFMGGARHNLKVTRDAIEQAFESVSLFGKWRNDIKTKVLFLMRNSQNHNLHALK